jgi:hypothetical protein
MMTSPAATGAAAAQARKLTLDRYEPFLAQNDFPPEQRERLLHFFDEKRQALLDVAIASYQNHLDPLDDFAAYQARVVDVRRTVDAQIRELLGGDTYAQLEDFDENMAEAATFTRLNRILAATPNAFSPDQTAQLSALLNSATHGTLSPELIDHAAKFLTAAQIEALQSAYDTQESIPRQRALDLLPER